MNLARAIWRVPSLEPLVSVAINASVNGCDLGISEIASRPTTAMNLARVPAVWLRVSWKFKETPKPDQRSSDQRFPNFGNRIRPVPLPDIRYLIH